MKAVHPFRPGSRVALLFSGQQGKIFRFEADTVNFYSYYILLDSGEMRYSNQYTVVSPQDPLYLMVEETKLIMNDCGYRCLAIGKDLQGDWRTFLFSRHDQYNSVVRRNPDITFCHYWALNYIPEELPQ